ncbi:hypothetical protein EOPP23_18235 [Endozoicomonas sp. OPT23]|uniref:TetR/AcrR family transcriptional regulator n=1 Tax=Endozoicomonas sp. OPT23 TaxID=2072845 RepID=UPI00129AB85B|nr:TetR/AcrR family transcriptional regulator [Endozoicomonas sp. OPT23]MRI34917.1 hypothetical protein [Endozoicomonas sp. OPT23]
MARPSLTRQRTEEILDALELCILEKGIQACSLEYIAETAQMKRTILRHYIGNRDDIISALSHRWRKKFTEDWQQILAWMPSNNQALALVDTLFSSRSPDYIKRILISEALFSEARRLPAIKEDQKNIISESLGYISQILNQQYPEADLNALSLVASGIHANYILSESLLPLGMMDEIFQLKNSSLLLMSTLDSDSTLYR